MVEFVHQTVLLNEAVALLRPAANKTIVDGTLGGGGHTEALLTQGARVIGFDRDPLARAAAAKRLERFGAQLRIVAAPFSSLSLHVHEPLDGVLLDLGVSSPQLDTAERGFSFQSDAPLDMRMGDTGLTAAQYIEQTPESVLADDLYTYADERFSRPVAKALKLQRPQTTLALVEAVKSAIPRRAWPRDIHVATRTFQALRIAVNEEQQELMAVLQQIPALLKVRGVCAIISFHSLEDRAVKKTFRSWCGEVIEPDARRRALDRLTPQTQGAASFSLLTKKAITASEQEQHQNPRARSAKLRAVEKVA
jgi:16S rRNA (cytosine1402-N4)-methyltransferase